MESPDILTDAGGNDAVSWRQESKPHDFAQAREIQHHTAGTIWKFDRSHLDAWVGATRRVEELQTTFRQTLTHRQDRASAT